MKMMQTIKNFFFQLFHILFRHYNFPTKLGLYKIGNPGENSPVFVSGNYTLTVHRLKTILGKVTDCYLLVANSRGSNVWCAAGMNEFTHHDIVDAITVADLKNVVKHRNLIIPPYGAPGVDAAFVAKITGFRVSWGPVHMRDLPEYINNNFKKTESMTKVQFGLKDRMEQALAGIVVYNLCIGVGIFFIPELTNMATLFIVLAYIVSTFLWNVLPKERFFIRSIIFTLILTSILFGYNYYTNAVLNDYFIRQGVLMGVIALVVTDLCGSSTLYKTTIKHWLTKGNYESLFKPIVSPQNCVGCKKCLEVCPRGVLACSPTKKAVVIHPKDCIECLACIKQCKFDAIYNKSGIYKKDVKSIENLDVIMTRDWKHLIDEEKWVGSKVKFINGILQIDDESVIIEEPLQEKAVTI